MMTRPFGRTGHGVPKTTPDLIRLCGHAILGRMNTPYVDTLLCHESGIEDPPGYDGSTRVGMRLSLPLPDR